MGVGTARRDKSRHPAEPAKPPASQCELPLSSPQRLYGHFLCASRFFLDKERGGNFDVNLRLLIDNLQGSFLRRSLYGYLRRKQTHRGGRKIIKRCAQFRASVGS